MTLDMLGHLDGGVFSRAAALALGETDTSLRQACRAGALVRLRRGMYVLAGTYGGCDESGKHLLHARAALLAQEGPVALAGPSTAALHGLALYDQGLDRVHLVRLDRGSPHRAAGASHHRVRAALDGLTTVDGVLTVSAARAVWEVACSSTLEGAVVTADSALRAKVVTKEELQELAARFAHVPGSRVARTAVALADARSESVGESVTRVQFHRYDIPMPELQHPVVDGRGELLGITDFFWEQSRHIGEFDGRIKYGELLKEGESGTDVLFREKRREDDLRAQRYGMTRFVWSMVMPDSARRSMAALAAALERSCRLYAPGAALIG